MVILGTVAVHGSVTSLEVTSPLPDEDISPASEETVLSLAVAVAPLVEASVRSEDVKSDSSDVKSEVGTVVVPVRVDLIVVIAVVLRVDSCGSTEEV